MILICDTQVSARAQRVQEMILSLGCPAAVSPFDDIKSHLPTRLIITFADVFSIIRQAPFDDLFVIAIGDGFINTALNARGAKDEKTALLLAQKYLCDDEITHARGLSSTGLFLSPIFFSKNFFEVYSNLVMPTEMEYMIFKYIYFCSKQAAYADADRISKYCFSTKPVDKNAIAAHISNLNKKISAATGKKIIKSKRFLGYYIDVK